MDRYKFYDDDDWNNIDLENDINYEESYRGFKIVRMEDGHYELYRLGRKRNLYMLDSGFPDNLENNQYEKKYNEPRYEWSFPPEHKEYKNLTAVEYIKQYIDSFY